MKQFLAALFGLIFFAGILQAQERIVSGIVTSSEGEPLVGATVILKGTSVGTSTDAEGRYAIGVDIDSATLIFSIIGYEKKEIEIISQSVIDVSLKEGLELKEVLIVAQAIEKEESSLNYAVQKVEPKNIVKAREANFVNALAGKIAGVQINSAGGQVGSASRIVLRGASSLTGDNSPLFVIDGIPFDNSFNNGQPEVVERNFFNGSGANRALDIDPNSIESVYVLKGAAAANLYGSRGANGVVMITTKKGEKKQSLPKVSISNVIGLNKPVIRGFQDQYLQGEDGEYTNGLPVGAGGYQETSGLTPTTNSWGPHKDNVAQVVLDSIGQPQVYDPREEFYQTGISNELSFNISGGKDNTTYNLTYSFLKEDGIVPTNEYKRHNIGTGFSIDLSDHITYNGTFSYMNSFNKRLSEGQSERSFLFALNNWPISHDINTFYTEDGEYYTFTDILNNPFWLAENNGNFSTVNRFFNSHNLDFKIKPWLTVTERFGIDRFHNLIEDRVNIGTRDDDIRDPDGLENGNMYNANIIDREFNNDLIINAKGYVGAKKNVKIGGLVGVNILSQQTKWDLTRGIGLNLPGFFDISNAIQVSNFQFDEERKKVGIYGALDLAFKEMVFLSFSGRNDWSSTLPENSRSYFYPAASAGIELTKMIGLRSKKWFSYGKIRGSWAQVGNDAPPYLIEQIFTPSDIEGITSPFAGQNLYELNNEEANPNLVNELVTEYEVGGDFRFFNERLKVDYTFYDRISDNQVLIPEVSATTGFIGRVVNAGEVKNRGHELTVFVRPIELKNGFNWDFQFNFAKNLTTIESLTDGIESIVLYEASDGLPSILASAEHGYGIIWGQQLARTDDGRVIIDDDGLPEFGDIGKIGNVQPDWTGSLRTDITFKGLTIGALLDMRIGGDVFNYDLFYTTFFGTSSITADRNTVAIWDGVRQNGTDDEGNPVYVENDIPVVKDESYYSFFYSDVDELFVEDASYLKLRELSLAYSLPSKWFRNSPLSGVAFSLIARNVWIKSNFTYWDPEGSLDGAGNGQGFYHFVTPGTRSYALGVNLNFN